MPIVSAQVATGMSAVKLAEGHSANDPVKVIVSNTHATIPVYLGGSSVSDSTGFKLAVGVTLPELTLGSGDELYAYSASASSVHVLKTRQ